MSKRTWSVASLMSEPAAPANGLSPQSSVPTSHPPAPVHPNGVAVMLQRSPTSSKESATPPAIRGLDDTDIMAVTTRKSSACPACRRQKIKCIMENEMPPCKRCAERGLLCSPNKTMQGLLKDQSKWNSRMKRQFQRLQAALNEARAALSLPPILATDEIDTAEEEAKVREAELSDDGMDGGEVKLPGDTLASAPIRSLYEITRTRTDTAPTNGNIQSSGLVIDSDFISRGVITLSEADQLTRLYLGKLDHYFYGHSQVYPDFAAIRKTSTLLALTVCTVASLHDPLGSDIYDKLSREIRSLTSSLMYRNRLGLEDIKALCMGCYWLADMTWMLSALVVRKAISMQYQTAHLDQPDTDQDDFVKSQMWMLIYLSNEQISMLQGVPPAGVARDFVNWEQHMLSPFAGEIDLRLVSHIDMLMILSRARQIFGLDTRKQIPHALVPRLREFSDELDRWGTAWSGKLARHKWIGTFPSDALNLHRRFSKFYICSHAFRGLSTNATHVNTRAHTPVNSRDMPLSSLSPDLQEIASTAITTAFSILDLLLENSQLQASLVGMPHYFHTMFVFAAVFLLKIATRYTQHVRIDIQLVFSSITRVLNVFEGAPCARQHLVHRITRGLKEMLQRSEMQYEAVVQLEAETAQREAANEQIPVPDQTLSFDGLQPLDLENFDFLSAMPPSWLSEFDF
ncbi:hypothetical protein V1512DRAFT_258979 [Lipomyces arxii]|uniref:uncharacterized protein n=1 Tax=Lipomyces arxii TaxID=56418 RepID=UPI0034CE2D9B